MSRRTMDLMQQIRLMGGTSAYSPSDCWFNLCSTLEWPIENDVDEPQRFQPAFFTASRKKGRDIPVIVEPYSYVPDDTDDPLADEAMSKLPSLFQGEILLVFRGLPFMETDGHFYTFGGLLYLDGGWHSVAINRNTRSIDDLLQQVEAGFTFGRNCPDYADSETAIATGFAAMSFATEPGVMAELMAMKTAGGWTVLVG